MTGRRGEKQNILTKSAGACYDTGKVYDIQLRKRSRGAVHFPLTFDRREVLHPKSSPIGGDSMVTYEALFAFCLVMIGVVNLVIQIYGNRK